MSSESSSVRTAVLAAAFLLTAAVLGGLFLFDGASPDHLLGADHEAALAKAEIEPTAADSKQDTGGTESKRELEKAQPANEPALALEEVAIPADATGVSGRIIGREGRPAPDVDVVIEKIVERENAQRFGVTVKPGERNARYLRTGRTDAEGRFTVIDLIPFEGYRIRAHTEDGQIGRKSGVELFQQVVLDVGDIPLRGGVLVSGRVRTDGGRPIAGAELEFGWSWSQDPIISDEQGKFHSSALFPGKHSIKVKAPGYALPESYQREFLEDDQVTDLDLVLVRAAPIRGRVVDEAGRGIGDAWISVYRSSRSMFGWYGDSAMSNQDGSFAFESVAPGKYQLWAHKAGYRRADSPEFEAGGSPLEVRLIRSAMIEGLVVDAATGQALEPEEIQLYWIPPWKQKQGGGEYEKMRGSIDTQIRPDGSFSIGVTRGGAFRVEARTSGYAPSFSDPFDLKENGAVSGILLRLLPGIQLDLTVLDQETREPIPGAVASLYQAGGKSNDTRSALAGMGYSSGPSTRSGRSGRSGGAEMGRRVAKVATGPDGRAEVRSLIPGSFVLEAKKRGYAPVRKKDLTIRQGVTPAPIELLMGPGGAVSGRVTNSRGEPEPALKVVATGVKVSRGEAVSLADGRYRIENLLPGRYKVEALLENGKSGASSSVFFSGRSRREQKRRELTEAEKYPVVVTDGQDSSFDLTVVRVDPGSLKGSVLINGAPAAGIELIASRVDPENPDRFGFSFNLRAKSDSLGSFEFRRLDPGQYSLLVFRSWSSSFSGGRASVTSNQETMVTVDVGLGSIGGVVLGADSRPLEGARIRLNRDRSGRNVNPFGGSRSTESGLDGGFLIEELEAGLYDLTVTLKGHRTERLKAVEVAIRRNTGPLRLQMKPGGWIKARVAGATAVGSRPARLRLAFQGADQERKTSRWARPDGDGIYWLEVSNSGQGTLTVTTRSRDGQPERMGRAMVDLQEGLNAEVSVQLR